MKKNFLILAAAFLGIASVSAQKKFGETWSYYLAGYENEFIQTAPITDLCYFSADVDEYGEIKSIPDRNKIPSSYNGRVHLVSTCESRSLSHFILDPKYGVTKKIVRTLSDATKDFDGLQIDYELVPSRDDKNFRDFLKALKKSIGKDKMLSVCVHARMADKENDPEDYAELAKIADRIFIMAYDQHWSTSKPGPVAGMDWSRRIVDYAQKKIPQEKLIVGLPLYGRSWVSPNYAHAWYNSGINRILKENGSPKIQRREGIPHFEFKMNVTVTGWFDDKESLQERCEMLLDKNVKNVGFWRMGQEDADFWPVLESML